MTKTKFPTIADISFAIITNYGGFASVRYNKDKCTFIVKERVPIVRKLISGDEYYDGHRIRISEMSYKEGYDIYNYIQGNN